MKTIAQLMTIAETREYCLLKHVQYEKVKRIIEKPFIYVTVCDIFELAKTDIFDLSFPELLFAELWKRYDV